jgi:hypothetical protein
MFNKKYNHYWHILICILLIILIFLALFIIYYKNDIPKKEESKNNIIIIKSEEKKELPVHPITPPVYNNITYQHIGVITSDETDKEPIILPLFGKKINNRNDRWNYYTATDKNNMIRLPIKFNNANCEDDIGCREVYNDDKIEIELYKGRIFTVLLYKVDSPQYFAEKY